MAEVTDELRSRGERRPTNSSGSVVPTWARYLAWSVLLLGMVGLDLATTWRYTPYSAILALDAVAATAVVVWPVVAAVAALEAVSRTRAARRPAPRMPGAPSTDLSRVREYVGPLVVAYGLGSLLALAWAWVHGSTPSLAALAPVPIAAFGCWAFALAGSALGKLLPNWLTPAIIGIATYCFLALDIAHAGALVNFAGATVPERIFWRYTVAGVIVPVISLVLIALAGFALSRAVSLPRLLGSGAALVAVFVLVTATANTAYFRSGQPGAEHCASQAGITVCVPADQAFRLQGLTGSFARVFTQLKSLDPTLAPITADFEHRWDFPTDDSEAKVASATAYGIGGCFDSAMTAATADEKDLDRYFDAASQLISWLTQEPDVGTARTNSSGQSIASAETARRSLAMLRSCSQTG